MQGETEQRPHKVSYHVSVKGAEAEQQITALKQALQQKGLLAKVIYSGGEDLDILPEKASKGKGLEFLLEEVCHLLSPFFKAHFGCSCRLQLQ